MIANYPISHQPGGHGEERGGAEGEVVAGVEAVPEGRHGEHGQRAMRRGPVVHHASQPHQRPLVPAVDVGLQAVGKLGRRDSASYRYSITYIRRFEGTTY